jgi:hypothetical protein
MSVRKKFNVIISERREICLAHCIETGFTDQGETKEEALENLKQTLTGIFDNRDGIVPIEIEVRKSKSNLMRKINSGDDVPPMQPGETMAQATERVQRAWVFQKITENSGNVMRTAQELDITRVWVRRLLGKETLGEIRETSRGSGRRKSVAHDGQAYRTEK